MWDFILILAIGLLAGWLAGKLMKGGGYGLVGNLIIGVIGAIIGGYIFELIGIPVRGIVRHAACRHRRRGRAALRHTAHQESVIGFCSQQGDLVSLNRWLFINALVFVALGIAFSLYAPLVVGVFEILKAEGTSQMYWYSVSFARLYGAALFGFGFLTWAVSGMLAAAASRLQRQAQRGGCHAAGEWHRGDRRPHPTGDGVGHAGGLDHGSHVRNPDGRLYRRPGEKGISSTTYACPFKTPAHRQPITHPSPG